MRVAGTLSFMSGDYANDSYVGLSRAPILLAEGTPWPTLEQIRGASNSHNVPVDPMTLALTRLMGIDWLGAVAMCGLDDEGYTFTFRAGDGSHELNLPTTHGVLTGRSIYGKTEGEILSVGNQTVALILDQNSHWRVSRVWPDDGGPYYDRGEIVVSTPFPTVKLAHLQSRVEDGDLRLSDAIAIPGLEIDPKVTDLWLNEEESFIQFHFPQGHQEGK